MKTVADMKRSFLTRLLPMLTLLAGMSPAAVSAAEADRLYTASLNPEPGETRRVALILESTQDFYGFQADIQLPEGMEFLTVDGKPDITLSDRADDSYRLLSNLTAPGAVRLGTFSATHTPIAAGEGALLYAELRASEDFAGGELRISNILFINAEDQDVALPEFTMVCADRHADSLYISDLSIGIGESATVSVALDNETPFTAFQTDLYIPEGLRLDAESFALTDRAAESHQLSVKSFDDGRTRVICNSLENALFSGDSGAVFSFSVTADAAAPQEVQIRLAGTVASMATGREYSLPETTANVDIHAIPVESIELPESVDVEEGNQYTFDVVVAPENATVKELSWESSDPEIGTVADGVFSALKQGVTTVTCRATDGSGVEASCQVTVKLATGVETLLPDGLTIRTEAGAITVSGVAAGTMLRLYTTDGMLLTARPASRSEERQDVPCSGTYILQIGDCAAKIFVP